MSDRLLYPTEEPKPLPEAPPNLSALAAGPFVDGVHVRLKLNFDVTHLTQDGQQLLLHYVSQAVKQLEESVRKMDRLEVAKKLAQLERIKGFQGEGKSHKL
jgi:hypothetical protein